MVFLVLLALCAQTPVGSLDVNSDPPGAEVKLDGVPAGSTPVHLEKVPAGFHDVVVTREGMQAWHRSVMLRPEQVLVLDVVLAPVPVTTVPQGVRVDETGGNVRKQLVAALRDFPWSGVALAVAIACLLASFVFFTTVPGDFSLVKSLPFVVPATAWRGAAVTTLFIGLVAAAAAVGLLVLRFAPVRALFDRLTSS